MPRPTTGHCRAAFDTRSLTELVTRFGSEVAAIVAALTEDPDIQSFDARKEALRGQIAKFDSDAVAVDAADKVAKVRELRARAGREPGVLGGDDDEAGLKLEHYYASLEMLEGAEPDRPLVRQLRFELEALLTLPPGGDDSTPQDLQSEDA